LPEDEEFFADREILLAALLAGGLLLAELGILGSIPMPIPPPYVIFLLRGGSSSLLFRTSTGFFRNLIS
jgi:hypothetical protein